MLKSAIDTALQAHSYPNGASCISTAGALSLVTPAAAQVTDHA